MAANDQGVVPANGLAVEIRKSILAPSKQGLDAMQWVAALLVITTITYFWGRLLKETFEV